MTQISQVLQLERIDICLPYSLWIWQTNSISGKKIYEMFLKVGQKWLCSTNFMEGC